MKNIKLAQNLVVLYLCINTVIIFESIPSANLYQIFSVKLVELFNQII